MGGTGQLMDFPGLGEEIAGKGGGGSNNRESTEG
jgi:hypothetical protein